MPIYVINSFSWKRNQRNKVGTSCFIGNVSIIDGPRIIYTEDRRISGRFTFTFNVQYIRVYNREEKSIVQSLFVVFFFPLLYYQPPYYLKVIALASAVLWVHIRRCVHTQNWRRQHQQRREATKRSNQGKGQHVYSI